MPRSPKKELNVSARGLKKKGEPSTTKNIDATHSKPKKKKKFVVRVKVLGLAGITVKPSVSNDKYTVPKTKKSKGKKSKNEKKKGKQPQEAPPVVLPQVTSPTSLKALVAISREQKIKGTSPPSELLAPSPAIPTSPKQSTSLERFIAVWPEYHLEEERTTVFETSLYQATANNQSNNDDKAKTSFPNHPKSFDVAIALGDETAKRAAYTLGIATLTISGDECMEDALPKVLDLPVLGLDQAQPNLSGTAGTMNTWLPVIPMGSQPMVQDVDVVNEQEISLPKEEVKAQKKKKGFGLFRKKKKKPEKEPLLNNKTLLDNQNLTPAAKEKEAFLKMYGIDSCDAVLRVSVEVFEKGSELEQRIEDNKRQYQNLASNLSIEVNDSGFITESRSKSLLEDDSDDDDEYRTIEPVSHNSREDSIGQESTNQEEIINREDTFDSRSYHSKSTHYTHITSPSKTKTQKKSILNNVMGACAAPCGSNNNVPFNNETQNDTIFSEEEYYDAKHKRNKSKHTTPQKHKRNQKSKSSSSPRSVNDLHLSPHKSFDSQTNSQTYSRGDTYSSYSHTYDTYSKGEIRKNNSVMQTIQDVLQCSGSSVHKGEHVSQYEEMYLYEDEYDEDELYANPPAHIDASFEAESIGDLTDLTYEYERRRPMKTKDLKPKVSPNVVLAQQGKALTGRVLLPTAFGGDGMCIGFGAPLVSHGKGSDQTTTDYERILFRQQQELKEVDGRTRTRSRAKRSSTRFEETHDNHDYEEVDAKNETFIRDNRSSGYRSTNSFAC